MRKSFQRWEVGGRKLTGFRRITHSYDVRPMLESFGEIWIRDAKYNRRGFVHAGCIFFEFTIMYSEIGSIVGAIH